MLYIKSESFLSKKGKRDNNEDSIFSIPGLLYLVCDGVGGNGNGLLASQLVNNSVVNHIQKEPNLNLSHLLAQVEKELSNYKKKHPLTLTMASTIAFTLINNSSITIAWIGDSTVYQIRAGKILYKTNGHCWVSEAIQRGELTELEGYFHPNRNLLTRSVKGVENPTEFDSFICTDIEENDYFIVCSDGIQEAWIDKDLEALFDSDASAVELIKEIDSQCDIFSFDNYSAHIFKIGFHKNKKNINEHHKI